MSELHIAITNNKPDVVRSILSQSLCNIHEQDDNGDQAAHIAARLNHIDCIKVLIEYDAQMGFNMYTKTEKSSCFYAAGYYIIRFDFAWAQAFSPKVMTLKRNEFRGPYKTEMEMKEQLRLYNGKDKN